MQQSKTSGKPSWQKDAFLLALNALGLLLVLPALLFCAGFFTLWVQLLAYALAVLLPVLKGREIMECVRRLKSQSTPLSKGWVYLGAGILLLALFSALLPGFGGIFSPTGDIMGHLFKFKELLRNPWPVHHGRGVVPGMPFDVYLRYSLGFYIIPAWLGWLTGAQDLTVLIVAYTTAIYACIYAALAFFFAGRQGRLELVAFALLAFVFFGDLDTLFAFDMKGVGAFFWHNEHNFPGLEYSSITTLVRWIPQHGIPAIYGALFFLSAVHVRRYSLAECAVPFLAVCVWSPMVAIGFAFLLGLYALLQRPPLLPALHKSFAGVEMALSALLGIVLLFYFSADAGSMPHGIYRQPFTGLFLVVNIGALAWLAWLALRGGDRRIALLILLALCVLPLLHGGRNNDLDKCISAPLLAAVKILILAEMVSMRMPRRALAVALLLLVACMTDGMSELLYPAIKNWAPTVAAFDPTDQFSGQLLKLPYAHAQYFARCDPHSFIIRCQ